MTTLLLDSQDNDKIIKVLVYKLKTSRLDKYIF